MSGWHVRVTQYLWQDSSVTKGSEFTVIRDDLSSSVVRLAGKFELIFVIGGADLSAAGKGAVISRHALVIYGCTESRAIRASFFGRY